MDRLFKVLFSTDLELVRLLRYLFLSCSAQEFAAGIRKHSKVSWVDEGMIVDLKNLLDIRPGDSFGANTLVSLALLAPRMKCVLK